MTEPGKPSEAAQEEAARQAVILVFGVAAVAAYVFVQRAVAGPDFLRTWRMRAAKAAERNFAGLAGSAWRAAERARRAYEAETAGGS